jgi:long-subunit fatty acid transport protein
MLLPAVVRAQGGFVTFQFSFSNPGARSMGLGGAFAALADDATTAFANPAGLVQLAVPEISAEGRTWSYSTPYTKGGRISGEPSGNGLDTTAGLRFDESDETATELSFVSLVYPRRRWSLAFYRHQLARFEFSSETQGLFANPFPPDIGFRRENDRRISTELDIVGYGLAAAWRATDTLSLGLGLVHFDIGLAGEEELFTFDSLERFFERNSYLPRKNTENLFFDMDDTDLGIAAGLLWKLSPRLSLGGFYRQGPRGVVGIEILSGTGDPAFPPGTLLEGLSSPVEFPDVFGVGIAFRSADDRLTLGFEWDRVEYSTILESVTFEHQAKLDDGDELHAGAEYVFLGIRPVTALRVGAWLDPDHRLRDEGGEPLDRATFRRGEDELHFTLGLGLVFGTFQLDLGIDVSDLVDTGSISTIYSF